MRGVTTAFMCWVVSVRISSQSMVIAGVLWLLRVCLRHGG